MDASDLPKLESETKAAECPKHGPFASRGMNLPFSKGTIWTQCPGCQQEANDEEERKRRQEEDTLRQSRMENRLRCAGIPLRFRSRTMESFRTSNEGQARALAIAQRFVAEWPRHEAEGTTAIFSGKPGTGKSHLAIAMAQALMSRTTVLYTSALDAIRMVRDTWRRGSDRSEQEVLRELGSVGLLVLDEVGMQYGTEGEQVVMFDIINRRYQDQRPMVLLTNQGKDGLKTYLGDRAFDRLRESGIWVPFDWESHRGNASA